MSRTFVNRQDFGDAPKIISFWGNGVRPSFPPISITLLFHEMAMS